MRQLIYFITGLILIALLLLLMIHSTSAAAPGETLTVNSVADTDDGSCDGADCTLREAINAANETVEADTIAFNIADGGLQTIQPLNALPTITEPLIIDGTTQPGYSGKPLIELDGCNAGDGVDGLRIRAGESIVRGLIINRFADEGLVLENNGSNVIVGNFIGTDATGTLAFGNGDKGLQINNSPNNTIGGVAAQEGNLISGNGGTGISLFGEEATGNQIVGNLIGVDQSGMLALGNGGNGIYVNVPSTTIGGIEEGAGNVISANMRTGVFIEGSHATGNQLLGNFIGTNAEGTASFANSSSGIYMTDTSSNIVGGVETGARNLISGNALAGVYIQGSESTDNQLLGNFIGTDVTGTAALPNRDGVWITDASGNMIGGLSTGAGNLISGNSGSGILIASFTDESWRVVGNQVVGNTIGTDVTRRIALGNAFNGVLISSGSGNIIGGEVSAARNLISGNLAAGVAIEGGERNQILGNWIGLDGTGLNALGNQGSGIFINNSHRNLIGDVSQEAGNVISGNGGTGIHIRGDYDNLDPAEDNQILSNFIGTASFPITGVGNAEEGILLYYTANTKVGSTEVGNIIAFNGSKGINILKDSALNQNKSNTILLNSIYSNADLGIDLGNNGISENDEDEDDADEGANGLQNYPLLTGISQNREQIIIRGSLKSTPQSTFRLEFFTNDSCHPSGHGEGQQFLAAQDITTDNAGNSTFSVPITPSVTLNNAFTATATDAEGNTSEFSQCYAGPIATHQLFLPLVER